MYSYNATTATFSLLLHDRPDVADFSFLYAHRPLQPMIETGLQNRQQGTGTRAEIVTRCHDGDVMVYHLTVNTNNTYF